MTTRKLPNKLAATTLTLLFALPALAGAAASHGSRDPLTPALRSRGIDPAEVVRPYALSDEIRRWAHATAPPKLASRQKLERLLAGLVDADARQLEYSWGYTATATEVFETRRANCLAFTNLFVGLAREVGVDVYFLAVETETYRKADDLVVVSDHVAVGFGRGTTIEVFDFSDNDSEELYRVRVISDLTAVAMFHSNRGAESLQNGQHREAVGWLRTAVALDSELPTAWVNLGVALRRSGNLAGAEEAYKTALELDPRVYSAYHNLASLLRLSERPDEARQLEQTLRKSPNKNPYTYLSLGDISFANGRLAEARRFYRRAAHLSSKEAETYAALGQVAVAEGDLGTARRMLKKARKLDNDSDSDSERTARLAAALAPGQSTD